MYPSDRVIFAVLFACCCLLSYPDLTSCASQSPAVDSSEGSNDDGSAPTTPATFESSTTANNKNGTTASVANPPPPSTDADTVQSKLSEPISVNNPATHVSDDLPKAQPPPSSTDAESLTTTATPATNATTDTISTTEEAVPDPVEVTSQNYPKPYPGLHTANWSLRVDANKWENIDVRIESLDIDESDDILLIRAGHAHDNITDAGITLTGKLDTVKEIKLMRTTELFIFFQSNTTLGKQKHRGFRLTYAPFGRIQPVSVDATEPTTTMRPIRDLQTFTIQLTIDESLHFNETWHTIKVLLAKSANEFVMAKNLSLTKALPDNVILQTVIACPRSWPNFEQCIRVRFAIPLAEAALNETLSTTDIVDHHVDGTELTTGHLEEMWRTIGAAVFADNAMPEYRLPDTDHMLLLWSAIGLAVMVIFLLLLYSIWKMDMLRDYHRMPGGKTAEDKKTILARNRSEIDISMFPSPHQIVPSLFPAGDPMNAGGVLHEYESRPIRFSREDFPASRNEFEKQHIFTPNIAAEPIGPTTITMTSFMGEEEDIYSRNGNASAPRQRPTIRGSNTHESMT